MADACTQPYGAVSGCSASQTARLLCVFHAARAMITTMTAIAVGRRSRVNATGVNAASAAMRDQGKPEQHAGDDPEVERPARR